MLEQEFILKPSAQYNLLIACLLAISLVALMILPFVIMLPGLAVLGGYGFYLFWRFGFLRGKRAIIFIKHQDDGAWHIKTRGRTYTANLCGSSVITPYISVLRFKADKEFFKPACVIFKDSLQPDQYRKLIITCRMT